MGIRSKIRKKLAFLGSPEPQPAVRTPEGMPQRQWEPEPEPVSPRGDKEPKAYIEEIIGSHPIVLFMKGSPAAPQCGFSASASGILSSYSAPLHTVDILIDSDVREAIKAFSSWPTLPQVYISGEFVGGSDILTQLHEGGDLKELVEAAAS